ncbi:6-bladed beta-propeller [Acidobacteriota bacterium]
MKNRITLPLLIILLFSFAEIHARSIQHVRTIRFHDNSAKKKSVNSLIFGRKKTKAVKPCAICRVDADLLCVTDAVNGTIIFSDTKGNIKKRITHIKGIKIISPVSACMDEKGNLYIADSTQGGIIRFDRNLNFQDIFVASNQWRITGIVFVKGFFYCVDTRNHQVLCFDQPGQLRFSFGKRGSGEGEFNFPTHIAADGDYLYVTDAMNFRVQIFDHKGQFVRAFGSHGRGGGHFSKPKGIAVSRKKHVFVADAMFDNIQVFNLKGDFLSYFGGPGQQDGQFWMPSGIMVDRDDTIWLADTFNRRIQVFRLVEDGK